MGKMQREKGARGEREIAQLLRPVFPGVHRRSTGEESQTDQGRDLADTPGLCAQVCRASRPPIERKVREALSASKSGELSVAFTRSDRGEWLATMPLPHWMSVYAGYMEAGHARRASGLQVSGGSDPVGEG